MIFIVHQHAQAYRALYCYTGSVCSSVECWYCVETVVNIVKLLSPSITAISLVFPQYVELRKSNGQGPIIHVGYSQFSALKRLTVVVLEMTLDRHRNFIKQEIGVIW